MERFLFSQNQNPVSLYLHHIAGMNSLVMKIKEPVWRSGKKNNRLKERGKKGKGEGGRRVNGGGEGRRSLVEENSHCKLPSRMSNLT